MSVSDTSTSTAEAPRPRYELLDGLRGVAALIVIVYHIFEGFATDVTTQTVNHGYLAVDFFFILSGFVIGYAYDGRWKRLTVKEFFRRRLIRLHPMVILGVVLGVIAFLLQGSVQWDGTTVSLGAVLLAGFLHLFMIPAVPGALHEVRGNGELFPLNGPHWSLFFEYIGNIFYALFLRRFSTRVLAIWCSVCGVCLAFVAFNTTFNVLGVGWTAADFGFVYGLVRMTFSFSAGLLLSRVIKPIKIRGAFWFCTAALIVLLGMPYMGLQGHTWYNAVYELLCIMGIFPFLVIVAASGQTTDAKSSRVCDFLGKLSFPVYAVHYPLMYLFYAWVWSEGLTFAQSWHVALLVVAASIAIAWLAMKYYDEPVRRWLDRKTRAKAEVKETQK